MKRGIARVSRLGAGLLLLVCFCLLLPSGAPVTNVNASARADHGVGRASIPLDVVSDTVGATAAEFRVDESGAATYSVPLYAVPGTAGVMPRLSLDYSSQGGSGPIGRGWSIGGLSSIGRCRATREAGDFISGGAPHDGTPQPISFDGNDRFCLDGQRLIEVSNSQACAGVAGLSAVQLRTEIESFQRACAYTPTGGANGPAFFTVERKDGSISWYGNRAGSTIREDGYVNTTATGKTAVALAWAQTRFQDSTGNYIDFTYHKSPNGMVGEHLLAEVRFTGKVNLPGQSGPTLAPYAKLAFNYELLPQERHEPLKVLHQLVEVLGRRGRDQPPLHGGLRQCHAAAQQQAGAAQADTRPMNGFGRGMLMQPEQGERVVLCDVAVRDAVEAVVLQEDAMDQSHGRGGAGLSADAITQGPQVSCNVLGEFRAPPFLAR